MNKVINLLESIGEKVGKAVSYLTTALMLLICYDVLMRYFFDSSQIWMTELEIYFYSFIFLLGSAYAFNKDKHVRVDVFYAKFSPKKKAWTNLIGGLFLLLPWCVVILIVSFDYAMTSFNIGEGSAQPGGLPALYILKFSIFVGFLLLFLQGIASVLKSILVLREGSELRG
ncbi:MAG: TRAP transporter small permease subunit [Chitinophagales bacterium]